MEPLPALDRGALSREERLALVLSEAAVKWFLETISQIDAAPESVRPAVALAALKAWGALPSLVCPPLRVLAQQALKAAP